MKKQYKHIRNLIPLYFDLIIYEILFLLKISRLNLSFMENNYGYKLNSTFSGEVFQEFRLHESLRNIQQKLWQMANLCLSSIYRVF